MGGVYPSVKHSHQCGWHCAQISGVVAPLLVQNELHVEYWTMEGTAIHTHITQLGYDSMRVSIHSIDKQHSIQLPLDLNEKVQTHWNQSCPSLASRPGRMIGKWPGEYCLRRD